MPKLPARMENQDNKFNPKVETVLARIKREGRPARRRHKIAVASRYAAVIAAVAVISTVSLVQLRNAGDPVVAADAVDPSKVILKLSEESQLQLDDSKRNSLLAADDGVVVTTDEENTIKYSLNEEAPATEAANEINEVVVPRKGFVKLVLTDGTAVFVNSSSKLSFPKFFTGNERRVRLSGEAYFEVAHDSSKPFYVETDDMDIRVLGTSFNVSAYHDDSRTSATLVEGSVEISTGGDCHMILSPGEQGTFIEGSLEKHKVDTNLYTSWTSGKYMFNKTPLEDICRMMCRWYDTNISFSAGDLKNIRFTGVIPREYKIEEVIWHIENTSKVGFRKTENGFVIVKN